MRKKSFLILMIAMFFYGCDLLMGPDEPVRPTNISVIYERYIAGGVLGYETKEPVMVLNVGNVAYEEMKKEGEDLYTFHMTIETNKIYNGFVRDAKMGVGMDQSSIDVALNVYINGILAVKINNDSPCPWAGSFKFIIRNDGSIQFYSQ